MRKNSTFSNYSSMKNINVPGDFQGFKSPNYSVGLYYSDASQIEEALYWSECTYESLDIRIKLPIIRIFSSIPSPVI